MRLHLRNLRHTVNFLFCFLLLTSTAFPQVAAENKLFQIDDFSGGLATKPSPLLLSPNQADIAENVRFDDELGSFTKRDKTILFGTADDDEAITSLYRLYTSDGNKYLLATHGDEVEVADNTTGVFTSIFDLSSSGYKFYWTTWHDLAIGTDGQNQPIKCTGTECTYLGSLYAEDAEEGAGPNGTYLYKVSCYTTTYEISLGQASNSITVSDNDIDLSMIPLCPDTILGEDVTGRKVYRTEASGSTYKLLSNGTIADNTSTTLTDSDADGALGDALSATATYQPPKGKLTLLTKNRLFIANNPTYPSRLYCSEDGLHDYFESDNYFNIRANDGDEITFIKNLLGILTIGKNNTIQKLYTDEDDPDDWAISEPFSFMGCQSSFSAINTPVGIIYLGNNGIYRFNGQSSELLSDMVTPEIKDISPSNYSKVYGAFYKNKYFMAYTSSATGASYNNRILIFDLLTKTYSMDLLSVGVFTVLKSGTDIEVLYSGSSETGKVYAHTETLKEVIHNKHSDFAGTWDDMRYIPTAVGGDENDPVLELAWTETIDEITATIDSVSGIIDRPDTDGSYISQYLTLGANTLDKLYWNEDIPASGGSVIFTLRAGATTEDCAAATWGSAEFSDPTGSDVSSASADVVVQYRISMETDDIHYTPTLTKGNNYVVRLTYNIAGSTNETTIPIRWRTGWLDLGAPAYDKTLKKLYVFYETDSDLTSGTLNVTFENFDGDEDSFAIDLFEYPTNYSDYFTGGKFRGDFFRITIDESSLYDFKLRKIIVVYDIEPLI